MKQLLDIQNYYYNNLCNKNFVFETSVGRIVIKFTEANFAHLIGLHYFDKSYKGQKVWDKITKQEITVRDLRRKDKTIYKNTLLPRQSVLENVHYVFSKSKNIKKYIKENADADGFDCDFVFYNSDAGYYDVITCFIDKSTKSFCSPASLLRFYDGDFRVLRYIKPTNPTIDINDYYITDEAVYNAIDFNKLDSLT